MSMAKRVEGPPAAYRPVPVAGDRARHEVAVVMPTEHQSVGVWLPHAELRILPSLRADASMLADLAHWTQNTTALTEAISEGQGHPKRLVS